MPYGLVAGRLPRGLQRSGNAAYADAAKGTWLCIQWKRDSLTRVIEITSAVGGSWWVVGGGWWVVGGG